MSNVAVKGTPTLWLRGAGCARILAERWRRRNNLTYGALVPCGVHVLCMYSRARTVRRNHIRNIGPEQGQAAEWSTMLRE